MSIEFACQQCENILSVEDENAGKTLRCSRCGTPNSVPGKSTRAEGILSAPAASSANTANHPSAPEKRFFVDTDFGQTFGPVNQLQLDQWVSEGRIAAHYVIREEGAAAGCLASDMFPALADGAGLHPIRLRPGTEHPGKTWAGEYPGSPLQPTVINLGDVFSHAMHVFQANIGLLLGTTLTLTVLNGISNWIDRALERPVSAAVFFLLWFAWLIVSASSLFLTIGMTQLCLKLTRGLPASYADLFGGGRKFIPILCLAVMVSILGFLAVSAIGVLAVLSNTLVIVVAVAGGGLFWLMLWPMFYLVIDDQAGIAESFGKSFDIAMPNIMNSFVLLLATIGIMIVGILALCIGAFFAGAFSWVLWTTAYLMMSGLLPQQKYSRA